MCLHPKEPNCDAKCDFNNLNVAPLKSKDTFTISSPVCKLQKIFWSDVGGFELI